MPFPYPRLALPAALLCWLAVGVCADPAQGHRNPLALQRSAYGSLVARLMKDSLHSYWHGGRKEKAGDSAHEDHDAPPAGKLKLLRPPPSPSHEHGPWMEEATHWLADLDDKRTERNSAFATSAAHRRFLNAAADWRLRLAYDFDPGDAALYEIAHFTAMSRAPSPEAAREAAQQLAQHTIDHALAPQSGLGDALTGAGAVINLFNDQLQPDRPILPDPDRLRSNWKVLQTCLARYHALREQADSEGWWEEIPEIRRQEIESYAAFLTKITDTIHQQLAKKALVP
ncbi:MAG: hypothetical protein JWO89_3285 [Verrucomicrobiaceae bacterium]|nr:hypothetical protein [Verrucomicrobiaceae bacterium]MDB6116941.1 hypothetical protein [Verrucomicrobiaceae bacterium]